MKLTFERFFAVAPAGEHPDHDSVAHMREPEIERERDLHELCDAWGTWCRTRRFYGPPPLQQSLIGKLSARGSSRVQSAGPDAPCGAELAALHLAVIAQPLELDRKVFELHYLWRVRNVKAASAALGVSRPHWYRLLRAFRRRVTQAASAILAANLEALRLLPSASTTVTTAR